MSNKRLGFLKYFVVAFKAATRGVMNKAQLILVSTVPFLYAVITIAAFDSPYSKLDQLPVQIVNQDTADKTGISANGVKAVTSAFQGAFGKDADITTNKAVNFEDYYMTVVYPKDYAKDMMTYITDWTGSVKEPVLQMHTSYEHNFIIGKTMVSAGPRILSGVSAYAKAIDFATTLGAFYLGNPTPVAKVAKLQEIILRWKAAHVKDPVLYTMMDVAATRLQKELDRDPNAPNSPAIVKSITNRIMADATAQMKVQVPQNLVVHSTHNTYGEGIGTFFINVAIWVGIIMQTFIFLKPRYRKTEAWYTDLFVKYLLSYMYGAVQVGVLLIGLAILGFPLSAATVAFMFLGMIAFSTFIHSIVWMMTISDLGRFLVLVVLILQIPGAGGTFPTEMLPGFFRTLSHALPFTHAIDGMRSGMFHGTFNGAEFGYLLITPFCAFILCMVANAFQHRRAQKQIHFTDHILPVHDTTQEIELERLEEAKSQSIIDKEL